MPTSWYQAIPNILTQVKIAQPKSILDIGVGFGKYGLLFRDVLELPFERYHKEQWQVKIDGVEAFDSYHNPVYDFAYDNVYFGNILTLIDTLPNYDLITLIDVLEHFSKEDGLKLIEKLVAHCNKVVLVSTPLYPEPQTEYLGNDFEQHKSIWSIVDFPNQNFTYQHIPINENGAHLFVFSPKAKEKKIGFESLICHNIPKIHLLSIAYLLPHKNLTGGMKMLLQQMKYLRQKGHRITALLKNVDQAEESNSALPKWFDLAVDEEIIIPHDQSFTNYIPDCDIIFAGWVTQLMELNDSKIPVVYWEQGNEWLFGDIKNQAHVPSVNKTLELCYLTKHAILSVSPYVADCIYAKFGRKTPVLSNGIDTNFYQPNKKSNTNKILLVGNPHLTFKGFDLAFKALSLAWAAGYRFHVEWVCQSKPQLPNLPFPISTQIHPPQEELVKCYQSADIHLFTSWYEGFGMPPLEAMACGTPVVSTACGGVSSFAEHGYNVLLSPPGDASSLAVHIIFLIKFPQFRDSLSQNARKTAVKLDYSNVIANLENYLYAIWEESKKELIP